MNTLLEQPEINQGLADLDLSQSSFTTTLADRHTLSGRESYVRVIEIPGRKARFIIEWQGALPAWIIPTIQTMQELLDLPPGWDSYGAQTIDFEPVISALDLLANLMQPNTPMPAVVPTNRGGVQLEWHTGGIDLEIGIQSRAHQYASYHDHHRRVEWEGAITPDVRPLVDFIHELSRRR